MSTLKREIAARNHRALIKYREKRALRISCIDPCSPEWRALLNRFFQERREVALRWLFKIRCERRQALRSTDWSINARSKPHG